MSPILKPQRPLHEYVLDDVVITRWTVPKAKYKLTLSEQIDLAISSMSKGKKMTAEDFALRLKRNK